MNETKNLKSFLTEHVLLNGSSLLSDADKEQLRTLRKERLERPVILLTYTTQTKIAGAGEIRSKILQHLREKEYQADILHTGSLGLFSLEPMIQIQIPGKTRLVFHSIQP